MQRFAGVRVSAAAAGFILSISLLLSATAEAQDICNDLCSFKINDGSCDDGGPGSTSNFCPYGSDCTDCGVRKDAYTRGPTVFIKTASPTIWLPDDGDGSNDLPTDAPVTSSPTLRSSATATPTRRATASPTDAAAHGPDLTSSPTLDPPATLTLQPTPSPSKAPTTIGSYCSSRKKKLDCCPQNLADKGQCVYRGCKWNAKRRRCQKSKTRRILSELLVHVIDS